MEVLEDLLEACLAHFERYAAVAEEATAPYAQDGFTALYTGGDHKAQEGLHLRWCHVGPAFIAAKAFLELFGIHVGLSDHILNGVVRNEELEEVHDCGSGRHFLCRT